MAKKILYEEKLSGKYKLLVPRFNGTYERYFLKCFVLGETDKSYFIQILEGFGNHLVGDKFFVLKKNVVLDQNIQENSDFWYNNIESREIL